MALEFALHPAAPLQDDNAANNVSAHCAVAIANCCRYIRLSQLNPSASSASPASNANSSEYGAGGSGSSANPMAVTPNRIFYMLVNMLASSRPVLMWSASAGMINLLAIDENVDLMHSLAIGVQRRLMQIVADLDRVTSDAAPNVRHLVSSFFYY